MKGLAIREVAEQTGLAAGTIRMWEQRYGFPEPERTAAGYRLYSADDVDTLRRVLTLRETGLSVPAALERARAAAITVTDRPSIFGAVPAAGRTRMLRKRTLIAMSRAI
jgi:MerR family transcriptional regulator, light-induced transcriptional regulator